MGKCIKRAFEFGRILRHGLSAKSTEEFYDTFSPYYERFFGGQGRYADDAVAILGDYQRENNISLNSVLETGCGTGIYSEKLEKLCDELHGIDFSEGQLSHAQEKSLGIMLTRGNVLALPYPHGRFDLVTSLGMVRHLPKEMLDDYFKEAYRVLRPGGLFMFEPLFENLADVLPPHLKVVERAWSMSAPLYNAFMKWRGLDEHIGSSTRVPDALRKAGFAVEEFTSRQSATYRVILGRKP